MTTPLGDLIRATIHNQGPITFADYMAVALYHPGLGYYASGAERTGWRGHFLTSSELDPAWAQLWAVGFNQIWDACGRPDPFVVVEVGPGEGSFAAALLDSVVSPLADALAYHLVEPVPALQARQRARLDGHSRVAWSDSLDELPTASAGCVFANEVLDNLPVHLVTRQEGALRELHVDATPEGLAFVPLPPSTPALETHLATMGVDVADGHVLEVGIATESFVRTAARIMATGAVVFVDYGDDAAALAARPRGTLLCYSATGVDDRPLESPGLKDITAHVNWTGVASWCRASDLHVTGPRSQRHVLGALGSSLLDDRLRAAHADAVQRGDGAAALATLSRRQALGTLADPGGLGGLDVFVAVRGIPSPDFMTR